MVDSSNIEVLFTSSKSLNPSISKIELGKYGVTTLPTMKESLTDTKENCLLRFEDVWTENQTYSRARYCRGGADRVVREIAWVILNSR